MRISAKYISRMSFFFFFLLVLSLLLHTGFPLVAMREGYSLVVLLGLLTAMTSLVVDRL